MATTVPTDRQKAVLDYVTKHWADHGYGPSTKDVQTNFGFKSYTAAKDHLFALAKKGLVEFSPQSVYPAGLMAKIKNLAS
tara:strand:+ start:24099 stop:24338 length:240 start_codon:yes stop_codon:yes gene_type:complete